MTTKSKYTMTEAQIEAMAQERTAGLITVEGFDGRYLQALIDGVQAKLGKKHGKRMATEAQLETLEGIAEPFYAAVLRGVVTVDIELTAGLEAAEATRRTRERNRRATFARSAKSTLAAWVKEGGDIRAINVATVTKTELRAAINAAKADRGTTAATRIEKAQAAILAAAAREGPDKAREHLTAVIERLQAALMDLPDEEQHTETAAIRTRAGAPTFREPTRVLNRAA